MLSSATRYHPHLLPISPLSSLHPPYSLPPPSYHILLTPAELAVVMWLILAFHSVRSEIGMRAIENVG